MTLKSKNDLRQTFRIARNQNSVKKSDQLAKFRNMDVVQIQRASLCV